MFDLVVHGEWISHKKTIVTQISLSPQIVTQMLNMHDKFKDEPKCGLTSVDKGGQEQMRLKINKPFKR